MAKAKGGKAKSKDNKKTFLIVLAVFIIIVFILVGVGALAQARLSLKPAIAVIPIHGTIGINNDADPSRIASVLEKADRDPAFRAIILDINSPGGSAVGSQEIAEAIAKVKKPTVAWCREVCASGAYWAASGADMIVAAPSTVTGSIGVISSYVSFEELMDTYGITYNRLVSGEFKDTGTPFKELTDREREYLMGKILFLKDTFVAALAQNRNLSFEYVDNLATGEIWLGSEGQALGLVDVLGGKEVAQQTAEQLAGISDSRLVRIEPRRPSLLRLLSGNANSIAEGIGRGMGAVLLEASGEKRVPTIET